jgi:D-alanyl-lipoteichoic acid acyltransferase DltB (MBOAT superfamily)
MAIGMARLLGFHFPINFRRPYLAASITDFWHRWHISLSRWLRDYLYIPLGGNRDGSWMTYRNLMLTMLLGGLWHGASWNFVIWGGYHGALLSLERVTGWKKYAAEDRWTVLYPLRAILTIALVMIGWVFFRASTFSDSIFVLSQMFGGVRGSMLMMRWHIWMAVITLIVAILEEKKQWFDKLSLAPAWAYGLVCAIMLLCVEIIGYTEAAVPFVYFQF